MKHADAVFVLFPRQNKNGYSIYSMSVTMMPWIFL